MSYDSSLVLTAGGISFDDVWRSGKQAVAQIAWDLSATTGNNFFDVIRCPIVCRVHVMLEAVAPASATPQLWCKFVHAYGVQNVYNDAHAIMATHEATGLASRFDMDAAELQSAGGMQTLTPHPGIEEGGMLEPIWNKSAVALQAVSIDGGDTGEFNLTLIITDLRAYYGLA